MLSTLCLLRHSPIWSALLVDEISILRKVAIEQWPTPVAALIHIVAVEKELHGDLWHFLPIHEHLPTLNNLYETSGIATAAFTLITYRACKVEALKVFEAV